MASRLMRVTEAADWLGFTESQLRHMVQRRQIPFVRVGEGRGSLYFDVRQLERWIERNSTAAVAS